MPRESEPPASDRGKRLANRAEFLAIICHSYTDAERSMYITLAARAMGPLSPAHIRRNDHRG